MLTKDYDGPSNCKHEDLDHDDDGCNVVCEACGAILHDMKDGDDCKGTDTDDMDDVDLEDLK